MFTNLPTDVMTNTFHWTELTPMGLEAAADAATPKLADFYEAVYAGSLAMASYMQPANAIVNWYDLSQPAPRAPYTLPLGSTVTEAASNMPTEVACVLSFQGDPVSGVPQSRRRGRIYLGGLNHGAIAQGDASLFPQFTTAFTAGVANGASTHLLGAGITGLRWSVWSPTTNTAVEITNGWVDNSPDTQRRRSVDPTVRRLWPV